VFGLSACSFSLASGSNPYGTYPGSLAAMHGPGKPARRVDRDAASPIAKADRPAKPARREPKAEPPKKPTRVGRVDPPARPTRVGRADPPAKPTRIGQADASAKPTRVG